VAATLFGRPFFTASENSGVEPFFWIPETAPARFYGGQKLVSLFVPFSTQTPRGVPARFLSVLDENSVLHPAPVMDLPSGFEFMEAYTRVRYAARNSG